MELTWCPPFMHVRVLAVGEADDVLQMGNNGCILHEVCWILYALLRHHSTPRDRLSHGGYGKGLVQAGSLGGEINRSPLRSRHGSERSDWTAVPKRRVNRFPTDRLRPRSLWVKGLTVAIRHSCRTASRVSLSRVRSRGSVGLRWIVPVVCNVSLRSSPRILPRTRDDGDVVTILGGLVLLAGRNATTRKIRVVRASGGQGCRAVAASQGQILQVLGQVRVHGTELQGMVVGRGGCAPREVPTLAWSSRTACSSSNKARGPLRTHGGRSRHIAAPPVPGLTWRGQRHGLAMERRASYLRRPAWRGGIVGRGLYRRRWDVDGASAGGCTGLGLVLVLVVVLLAAVEELLETAAHAGQQSGRGSMGSGMDGVVQRAKKREMAAAVSVARWAVTAGGL